jgi:hypothetical protein
LQAQSPDCHELLLVYEMTPNAHAPGAMKKNPLPVVRINGNLRFRRVDVEAWLATLAREAA